MAAGLKLYNTLTREKIDFVPIDRNNVRMYVCGPTVYDYAHIGNARPVIVFDVLYRLLRHIYGAEKVTYVRNITDVDDKINARALRDYPNLPLNEAIRAVTEKTEDQFHADVAALGCLPPDVEPRATDNIAQMIEIIQKLLDKGHAYVATGSEGQEVLFSTTSMVDYGQLSKRKLEDQQAGARVAVEVHKKNPADFVLWKASAATEPGWPADFTIDGGKVAIYGRPGWHIECSAMSGRYLGDVFDIHGGGLDLIFPHHENEIAQSRCAHGTHVMANVWMHNGFVQVEGRKMSKSEGNFVTIHELLATEKFGGRKWPGEVLRLAMLMTHYREPIDFSVKRLEEAERLLNKFGGLLTTNGNYLAATQEVPPSPAFVEALKNDLNVSAAIALLHRYTDVPEDPNEFLESQYELAANLALLGFNDLSAFSDFYGSAPQEVSDDLSAAVEALVQMRLEMLKAKNFAEADKIRDDLSARGIQLKDGKNRETGERVTTWEVKR
ncbi:cysteine--tRNA ligase [Rhizobium cremeum]|uniref:cysteine--tRNA ligase n=1 Tax=Rhizobium cremeum TaxID=2813827 RepID=UPI000DE2E24A